MAERASCINDSEQLAKATDCLNNVFKYPDFKSDIQKKAITNILGRQNDVFISLPNGYGRALCYELPAAMFANTQSTLIICAWKIRTEIHVSNLRELGVPCLVLDKDLVFNDVFKIMDDLNNGTIKHPCLIYVSLEIVSMENFKILFSYLHRNKKLAFVVFDETHIEQHWYNMQYLKVDFYEKMGNLRELYPEISWVAVLGKVRSGAITSLQNSLKLKTNDSKFAEFLAPVFRSNIFYECITVDSLEVHLLKDFIDQCFRVLKSTGKSPMNGYGIIYCKNTDQCKEITEALRKSRVPTASLHRELSNEEMNDIVEASMKGVYRILCVTSSSGMKIQHLNISVIVHWGLPVSIMSYITQASAAGKNGSFARCRIYETKKSLEYYSEKNELEFLENADTGNDVNDVKLTIYLNSRVMKDYFVNIKCRHTSIAEFYGDKAPKCIDKCDICIAVNNIGSYASKKSSGSPDKDRKDKKKIKALTKKMMMQNI